RPECGPRGLKCGQARQLMRPASLRSRLSVLGDRVGAHGRAHGLASLVAFCAGNLLRSAGRPSDGEGAAMKPAAIDYKTHILIGVRADGAMTVLRDWPSVPKQAEVEAAIGVAGQAYVTFILGTPTAIVPAPGHGSGKPGDRSPGSDRRW